MGMWYGEPPVRDDNIWDRVPKVSEEEPTTFDDWDEIDDLIDEAEGPGDIDLTLDLSSNDGAIRHEMKRMAVGPGLQYRGNRLIAVSLTLWSLILAGLGWLIFG